MEKKEKRERQGEKQVGSAKSIKKKLGGSRNCKYRKLMEGEGVEENKDKSKFNIACSCMSYKFNFINNNKIQSEPM